MSYSLQNGQSGKVTCKHTSVALYLIKEYVFAFIIHGIEGQTIGFTVQWRSRACGVKRPLEPVLQT